MKERTVITPRGLSLIAYIKDIFRYNQLLWAFSYRNLRARYAQTLAGILWAVANPVFSLLILGFVFGKVARMDTQGVDPFLFTAVGLAVWTYFSSVAAWSGTTMVNAQGMITKIYFPRLVIPVATSMVGLIDLLIVLFIVFFLFLLNNIIPSRNLIYLPMFLVATIAAGTTAGIWVAALCVRYRDFLHVVPFLLRIGLYASPVAYSIAMIDDQYRLIYLLNPLTGLLEGTRWCFFGGAFPVTEVLIFLVWLLVFFIGGVLYFNHLEKNIADII
jgi:lipopolysaccharide transport system permease protein